MGLGDLLSTQHGVQLPWKRLVQGWQAGRLLKQKVEWMGRGPRPPNVWTPTGLLSLSFWVPHYLAFGGTWPSLCLLELVTKAGVSNNGVSLFTPLWFLLVDFGIPSTYQQVSSGKLFNL